MSPHDDFENPQKTADVSASLPEPETADSRIEREDWTLFASLGTLPQMAGVPLNWLRRLCLKELTDNSLDAPNASWVTIKEPTPGCYVIQNDGDGFDGTPQQIARMFRINRPLASSKLKRLPLRGAFGNGLRVVAGTLIASGGGTLIVTTNDQTLHITPLEDGGVDVVSEAADFPIGTRIEISFGPHLPQDPNAKLWALQAIHMNGGGSGYRGNPSLHWIDAETFYMLVHASVHLTVRKFMEQFDGCAGQKASDIAGRYMQMSCKDMTRDEATDLLRAARKMTTPPKIRRLGMVGDLFGLPKYRASEPGTITDGAREPKAEIPFVIEAWAEELPPTKGSEKSSITVYVNRTPITGNVAADFDSDKDFVIRGCGLRHIIPTPVKTGKWRLALNITTPYMPIITLGKSPDLERFADAIVDALSKAIHKAHRNRPKGEGKTPTQKAVVLAHLDEAVAKVSGGGKYRYSERQLLYALRPIVMQETTKVDANGVEKGEELKIGNFKAIITDYEAEHGDVPNMYRDNRGALYQPHTGEGDIAVGTLMVEGYARPLWTFNKIVYIEKQGFFETLKALKWPERYDCALLTGKGYTTRAIRDLVDHLAGHDEPVQVFCVHDADAAGTMIMQTFQEATRARGARQIEIINFGLEPWEAVKKGLEIETPEAIKDRRPVANYVLEWEDDEDWGEWLQTNRCELNAMTTPQFIDWMDEKMGEHGVGKVVPPQEVIVEEAEARLEAELRNRITARILREADIDAKVAAARKTIALPCEQLTPEAVADQLEESPYDSWRDCVDEAVEAALGDRDF
jgi:hypothetical protein